MITPAQLLRRFQKKRGFTLAEVIIASTVFTVVSLIGVTVFVDVMRIQRRITLENAIYEDGRFMMERIAREVRQNTLDYEEYYRPVDLAKNRKHGQAFGCYAQQFYNPGTPAAIGAWCSLPAGDPALNPGCVIDKNTLDINTGENPYTQPSADPNDAHARCDEGTGWGANECDPSHVDYNSFFRTTELYLINPAGTQKTYISRKKVSSSPDEYSAAMLRLNGQDVDTDGIAEEWVDDSAAPVMDYSAYCETGYNCDPSSVTNLADNLNGLDGRYEGFVPLTPLRTTITALNFYISPLEDPRKAFAETDPDDGFQQQPHVTIVMTLQPAESEMEGFGSDPPTVSLQTTVSSRVYNEVKSYLGEDAC